MKTERVPGAVNKADADLNALDVQEVVDHYVLAYLVHTRMVAGERPLYHDTVVSALDGHILNQWNALQTVVGVGNSQYNGVVPINTTFSGGSYQMIDASRGIGGTFGAMAITNANHGTSPGAVYSNATNTWGDGKQFIEGGSTTGANGQTAAVNALWGLMNTYDMLKATLGWLSLDGNNTSTYIAAHVNTAYDNAYYSDTCKCMFIGDGSFFTSLGAIDVIGHEMGHGITAATSNLIYSGESGGLNESASDINGDMVEAYARAGGTGTTIPNTGNDWGVGKEISKTGTPLRFMYKPSKDGSSPDAWSIALKNLDVHYSSGPNNRMFYFLSQGSGSRQGRRLHQPVPGQDAAGDDRHRLGQGVPHLVQGEHDQVYRQYQLRRCAHQNGAIGAGIVWRRQQGRQGGAARLRGDQRRRRRRRVAIAVAGPGRLRAAFSLSQS